jgi:hypothetical protein
MTKRTPNNRDWVERRTVGRREADRGVCMFHDMCHDNVAEMKQNCLNNLESHRQEHNDMDTKVRTKLDWKVFALFASGVVSVCLTIVLFVAPYFIKMAEAVTTIKTNQQHLMREFMIEPVKK